MRVKPAGSFVLKSWGGDKGEAFSGTGLNVFAKLWERVFLVMGSQTFEEDVANECQICQEVGVA